MFLTHTEALLLWLEHFNVNIFYKNCCVYEQPELEPTATIMLGLKENLLAASGRGADDVGQDRAPRKKRWCEDIKDDIARRWKYYGDDWVSELGRKRGEKIADWGDHGTTVEAWPQEGR